MPLFVCKGKKQDGNNCTRKLNDQHWCFQHKSQATTIQAPISVPLPVVPPVVVVVAPSIPRAIKPLPARAIKPLPARAIKPLPVRAMKPVSKRTTTVVTRNMGNKTKKEKKKTKIFNDDCPICMESIEEKQKVVTGCGHQYHKECLCKINKLVCPLCNQMMTTLPKDIVVEIQKNQKKLFQEQQQLQRNPHTDQHLVDWLNSLPQFEIDEIARSIRASNLSFHGVRAIDLTH